MEKTDNNQDLTKVYNEMIALWMGVKNVWVHPMLGVYEAEDETGYIDWVDAGFRSLDYHMNWNLLMPVVEKIDKLFVSEIDQNNKVTKNQREADVEYSKVVCLNITANISDVYKSVVEFIRWHNTQNQTNNAK